MHRKMSFDITMVERSRELLQSTPRAFTKKREAAIERLWEVHKRWTTQQGVRSANGCPCGRCSQFDEITAKVDGTI